MYYRLTCPCGVAHSVSTSQAGQEIHCSCGNSLQVPTLRGLKELPPSQPVASERPTRKDADQARRPSILLGSLFAIIFLAIPTAIFFGYQRMKLDTSLTQEADQQQAFEELDAAGPLQLSEAWDSYSTIPLGPPTKPPFYYVQRYARTLEWRIAIAGTVALLAALAAAVVLVVHRQSSETRSTAQTH